MSNQAHEVALPFVPQVGAANCCNTGDIVVQIRTDVPRIDVVGVLLVDEPGTDNGVLLVDGCRTNNGALFVDGDGINGHVLATYRWAHN